MTQTTFVKHYVALPFETVADTECAPWQSAPVIYEPKQNVTELVVKGTHHTLRCAAFFGMLAAYAKYAD